MNTSGNRNFLDHAIWAIFYDLAAEHREEYEAWFHNVHIPEKLSRPGYLWAAHYELEGAKGFLALFGGMGAHTFLNPSPGQLAARQSAATKRYMTLRQRASACILVEEARVDGPDAALRDAAGTRAP